MFAKKRHFISFKVKQIFLMILNKTKRRSKIEN